MAHGVHSFPQAFAHPLHALSGPRLLGLLVALGTPHRLWDRPVVVHRAPRAGVGNAHGELGGSVPDFGKTSRESNARTWSWGELGLAGAVSKMSQKWSYSCKKKNHVLLPGGARAPPGCALTPLPAPPPPCPSTSIDLDPGALEMQFS